MATIVYTCDKKRCPKYDKTGGINNCGIKNCSATAWYMTCSGTCKYRNYALSLNPTPTDQDGDYA